MQITIYNLDARSMAQREKILPKEYTFVCTRSQHAYHSHRKNEYPLSTELKVAAISVFPNGDVTVYVESR